ncbi:MAG TPA: 4-hydroxythreonine-4-phosphate dehydrogenase PdxA [Wenzhouxiangella sp.]
MTRSRPVALVTPGEPAGIGPELVCQLAAQEAVSWVAVADPDLLQQRAQSLGLAIKIDVLDSLEDLAPAQKNHLSCWPVALDRKSEPGVLDVANAPYVVECLRKASSACLAGQAQALITGPVHKAIINQAGVAFTGHTEYLRDEAGVADVVMLLATTLRIDGDNQSPSLSPSLSQSIPLRVALVTTHLPLSEVPKAITAKRLSDAITITHLDLKQRFGIDDPHLLVLGLNPHAGEEGLLGREEIETITPTIEALKAQGLSLTGPLPADTAFVPKRLATADAVVAMYHDQGLPVLKHVGFGQAVNVTLGLPYIRTSVDHGTALDIAGQGIADLGSFKEALTMAEALMGSMVSNTP